MKNKKGSYVIIGRRWFDKVNVNTYHSVEIIYNNTWLHKVPFAYGYEDSYKQSAFDWLRLNGYTTQDISLQNDFYASRIPGINVVYTVSDVSRKKDL